MEISIFRTGLLSGYMQTGGVPSSTLGTALVSAFVILGLGSCLLAPLARMASRIRGTSAPALRLARWSGILSGMGALSLGTLSTLRGESVLVTVSCLVPSWEGKNTPRDRRAWTVFHSISYSLRKRRADNRSKLSAWERRRL